MDWHAAPARAHGAVPSAPRLLLLVGVGAILVLLLLPSGVPPQGLRSNSSIAPAPTLRGYASASRTEPTEIGPAPPRSLPTHSGPVPSSRVGFQGHYYVGAIYDGPNTSATDLAVDLGVPQDAPQAGDFYYVVLSAWDDSSSYDQIGFANDYGIWGVTYSTTSPCAQTYYFNADAYNLTSGTAYRFDMSIAAGTVTFRVAPVGGPVLWTHSTSTGGSSFVLSREFACGGGSSLDYTDYEEVYKSAAPVPSYDFSFTNDSHDGAPVSTWVPFSAGSPPSQIPVAILPDGATVENEPYAFASPPPLDAERSATTRPYSANVSVQALNGSTPVTLSFAGALPNSTVGLSQGSGTTPFSFQVTVDLSTSTAPGDYLLELQATDASGSYGRVSLLVDVVGVLSAGAPELSAPAVDVNESLTVREVALGGAGTLSYNWTGLPGNCTAPAASVTCSPGSAGNFTIAVTVRDSLGFESSSSSVRISVSPALSVAGRVSTTSVDLGQSVLFSATVRGGSGEPRLAWTESPRTPCTPSGSNLTCVPYEAGPLNVSLAVTDSNGAAFELRPTTVEVFSDPNVSLTATPVEVDLGGSITFDASASGGSGGYRWSWIDLPGTCGNRTLDTVECTSNLSDLFPVVVQVTDSDGLLATSPTTLVSVYPDPSVSLHVSASSLLAGAGLSMAATPSGGLGPFSLAWSGLPDGCAPTPARSITCNPSASGTYRIHVELTDSLGGSASNVSVVTVAPSLLGLPFDEGVEAIGGAMALVAAATGLVLYAWMKRRGTQPRPSEGDSNTRPVGTPAEPLGPTDGTGRRP